MEVEFFHTFLKTLFSRQVVFIIFISNCFLFLVWLLFGVDIISHVFLWFFLYIIFCSFSMLCYLFLCFCFYVKIALLRQNLHYCYCVSKCFIVRILDRICLFCFAFLLLCILFDIKKFVKIVWKTISKQICFLFLK